MATSLQRSVTWRVRSLVLGSVMAVVAGLGVLRTAQAASPQQASKAACAIDLATFCPGIEAGGGKKMTCLTANQSKLSPACAASLEARRAARAAKAGQTQVAQAPAATGAPNPAVAAPPAAAAPQAAEPVQANMRACRTDMATLCGSVEKGGGRRIKCLMENQSKLSPECAAAVSAGQAKRQNAKAACQDDAAKFCATARGPQRIQCLMANKAQLAPACAALVDRRAARQAQAPAKQ